LLLLFYASSLLDDNINIRNKKKRNNKKAPAFMVKGCAIHILDSSSGGQCGFLFLTVLL